MAAKLKRWLPWVLKGGLSLGLIAWVLSKVDLAAAWQQAKSVDPALLLACLALMAVQIALGAVRWGVVLRALSAVFSWADTFIVYYIGVFFSIVLPGAVGGDAVRMWFARRKGLALPTAINSVMLERVVTVFGLIVLVVATQPILLKRVPDLPGAMVFPLLSVAAIAGILLLTVLDRLPESVQHIKLVRGLGHLAADTRALVFSPSHGLGVLVVALIGHINLSMAVYVLAEGLGIEVHALDCLVLVPPVILITTLPISIGGWGLRETAMVTAFGFVGVADESALVLSILFGIVTMVMALPGGLVFLLAGGHRSDLKQAEAVEAELSEA